jgi:hypothetical protein
LQCGYFLPLADKRLSSILIERRVLDETPVQSSAFFCVHTDDSTVQLFWEALKNKRSDDARALISKSFVGQLDIAELEDYFNASSGYKNLIKVEFSAAPRSCKTTSILLLDPGKKNSIIHLHMIREPDAFGTWKIYGIEKE